MNAPKNSLGIGCGFLWRIAVSCLLITDIFLFLTGSMSITGWFLGGSYWITQIIIGMVVSSYLLNNKIGNIHLILMMLLIILFAESIFIFKQEAITYSSNRLNRLIVSAINNDAYISGEDNALSYGILNKNYSLNCDIFIPTIRRMDCMLRDESGVNYRVIGRVLRNGMLQVLVTPEAITTDEKTKSATKRGLSP